MKCPFCGNEIQQGAKFCGKCGAQMPQATQTPVIPPPPVQIHTPAEPQYIPVTPPEQKHVPVTPPEQQYTPVTPPEQKYVPVTPPEQQYVPVTPPEQQYVPVTPPPQYMPVAPPTDGNNAEIKSAASGLLSKLKSMPSKKLLTIAVPIVFIIIALVILLPMLGSSDGAGITDSISFFSDGHTVVVSGNNNAKFTVDGEMYSSQVSMDGSKAVLLTDYNSNYGGTLWFVTPTASVQIAEDVLAYQIADSGGGIVYLTDYDSRENIAALYLYDTGTKSSSRITDEAMYQGYGSPSGVCISPNGKSVAYVSDLDESSRELTGYIKLDGKSVEKFGDNMFVLALSDSGRYIYYAKINKDGDSASLYVRSGNNDNRLAADLYGLYSSMILNKDYSQAIFNMDGRSYISINGGERTKITNSTIGRFIVARGTQTGSIYSGVGDFQIYGINSFANTFALGSDGVFYIDSKYEASRVSGLVSYSYASTVSSDGKTLLFYTSSDGLASIDPTNPNAQRRDIANYVAAYEATADLKTIYYVTHDLELWCVKGTSAPVKIADDVSTHSLTLAHNSSRVFFLVDYGSRSGGELYYSDNGGKREKVAGGDDVTELWSTYSSVFYVNVDSELFRSNGNESFSLFMEDYR